MKKPYLSNYLEESEIKNPTIYYDEVNQITYRDITKKNRIIDSIKCGSTIKTKASEDSDTDEMMVLESTRKTFAAGEGDTDELVFLDQTTITETPESSDPDEFLVTLNI